MKNIVGPKKLINLLRRHGRIRIIVCNDINTDMRERIIHMSGYAKFRWFNYLTGDWRDFWDITCWSKDLHWYRYQGTNIEQTIKSMYSHDRDNFGDPLYIIQVYAGPTLKKRIY